MGNLFYILAVDGGGVRGAYAAHILERMEQEWCIRWQEQFSMFAGTSTGSIIASALACGMSASEISNLYDHHAGEIFSKTVLARLVPCGLSSLVASRYRPGPLKRLLQEKFGQTTLGEVDVPLLLPAVDIGSGGVHVFKSSYSGGFVRDARVLVADAVLASCSAPTYFPPHSVGVYPLADGGLWANNPSLVAVLDAKRRLGVRLEDVRVLSIGTGKSKAAYRAHRSKLLLRPLSGWGFATRWGRSKFIDFILNLQADTANSMLRLLLHENHAEQICRISFESDRQLPMDIAKDVPEWRRQADHDFSRAADRIRHFLGFPAG